jgi:hypothetical protein
VSSSWTPVQQKGNEYEKQTSYVDNTTIEITNDKNQTKKGRRQMHLTAVIPNSSCLMVIAGRQPSSSFKMLRQMVPEGYTFGWYNGGTNLHLGGYKRKHHNARKYKAVLNKNIDIGKENLPLTGTPQETPYELYIPLRPNQFLTIKNHIYYKRKLKQNVLIILRWIPSLPGIPVSHFMMSFELSSSFIGLA